MREQQDGLSAWAHCGPTEGKWGLGSKISRSWSATPRVNEDSRNNSLQELRSFQRSADRKEGFWSIKRSSLMRPATKERVWCLTLCFYKWSFYSKAEILYLAAFATIPKQNVPKRGLGLTRLRYLSPSHFQTFACFWLCRSHKWDSAAQASRAST